MFQLTRNLGRPARSIAELYRLRLNGKTLGEIELPQGAGQGLASGQLCVMQMLMVAYSGQMTESTDISDHPANACQVLGAFCRKTNDALGEGPRQRLKEYVVRIGEAPVSSDHATARERVLEDRGFMLGGDMDDGPTWSKIVENPLLAFKALDAMLAVEA